MYICSRIRLDELSWVCHQIAFGACMGACVCVCVCVCAIPSSETGQSGLLATGNCSALFSVQAPSPEEIEEKVNGFIDRWLLPRGTVWFRRLLFN